MWYKIILDQHLNSMIIWLISFWHTRPYSSPGNISSFAHHCIHILGRELTVNEPLLNGPQGLGKGTEKAEFPCRKGEGYIWEKCQVILISWKALSSLSHPWKGSQGWWQLSGDGGRAVIEWGHHWQRAARGVKKKGDRRWLKASEFQHQSWGRARSQNLMWKLLMFWAFPWLAHPE